MPLFLKEVYPACGRTPPPITAQRSGGTCGLLPKLLQPTQPKTKVFLSPCTSVSCTSVSCTSDMAEAHTEKDTGKTVILLDAWCCGYDGLVAPKQCALSHAARPLARTQTHSLARPT